MYSVYLLKLKTYLFILTIILITFGFITQLPLAKPSQNMSNISGDKR